MSFTTRHKSDLWEVLADGRPVLIAARERTARYVVNRLVGKFPAENPPQIAAMIWAEAFRADVESIG